MFYRAQSIDKVLLENESTDDTLEKFQKFVQRYSNHKNIAFEKDFGQESSKSIETKSTVCDPKIEQMIAKVEKRQKSNDNNNHNSASNSNDNNNCGELISLLIKMMNDCKLNYPCQKCRNRNNYDNGITISKIILTFILCFDITCTKCRSGCLLLTKEFF